MRIIFDARMYGHGSGIEVYIRELANRLVKEETSHEWLFLARKSNFEELRKSLAAENIKIIEADFPHYSWQEQVFLPRLLGKLNADLVHFPNFNVPILYKKPFVVTIHDMVHHKLKGDDPGRLIHRLGYKLVMEHAALRSKAIITVSKESKRDILKFFPQVGERKIYVIPQGVDETFLPQEQPGELFVLKDKYSLTPPYILFVGVWERKKNIPALAAVFAKIADEFPEHKLVLAGKEDRHHPEVKEQVKKAAGPYWNRVVAPGFISMDDLPILYRNASAFVSASTYEGFGMPGLEAMSCGTSVIVADTPVFREIYGEAAKYFNASDTESAAKILSEVLKNEKLRDELLKKGLAHSQKFSWQTTAIRTLSLYKEVSENINEQK